MRPALLGLAAALAAACAPPSPTPGATTDPAPHPAPASASAAASASASASAAASAPASAPASASAPAPASASAPAPAPAPAFVPDNKLKPPLESEDLTERARGLFEAIVRDDPALAEPFWFPKEPFVPLKDVKDPGKYWDNLHAAYVKDVKALHRKRKTWEGARFVGFEVGSTPKWVPPGDEVNKIGYFRSFYGKLRYEIDGKPASLEVHTIISWQGRWYITHLSKFKKK